MTDSWRQEGPPHRLRPCSLLLPRLGVNQLCLHSLAHLYAFMFPCVSVCVCVWYRPLPPRRAIVRLKQVNAWKGFGAALCASRVLHKYQ